MKNSFRNTRVSNSLDSDQARHFFGPDLGLNCFRSYQQTKLVGKECFTNFPDCVDQKGLDKLFYPFDQTALLCIMEKKNIQHYIPVY